MGREQEFLSQFRATSMGVFQFFFSFFFFVAFSPQWSKAKPAKEEWYECVPPDPQDPTKYGPCPGKPVGYKPTKFLWIYTPRNECRKELSCSGNQVEGTFLTYEDCVNKCVYFPDQ